MTPRRAVQKDSPVPQVLSDAAFSRFRAFIEDRCGLDFGESRRSSLEAALRTRMRQLGIIDHADYFDRLSGRPEGEEFCSLINRLTITETCFFRDPAQFRMLRSCILPALLRAAAGRRSLRICSAGCSSGAEPYSVALLLRQMGLHITHPDWDIEIVGIDVNTAMLEAAQRAVYSARAVRNVDDECLQQHFTAMGPQYRLNPEIADAVRFEHGSLTQDEPFPPDSFDIILCKNVAIYFRPEVTRQLVQRLHRAMREGGYLLLGHSESLWQMEQGLTLVEHDGVFCYRKPLAAETPNRREPASVIGFQPLSRERSAREEDVPLEPAGEYERCLATFRRGDWESVETGVREIIAKNPAFVPARLLLAGLHAHLGRQDEARKEAEAVLLLNDLEPRAHLLLGMIAARAGRHTEAMEGLERALYLDDSLALAYFWLGNLYRERGDNRRACAAHAQAVERYERHQLDFTEEFAADQSPAQIISVCRQSARLRRAR
jgi:chemotaxis protein methyltransferase CheR